MIGGEFAATVIVITFGVVLGRTTSLHLLVITLIGCVCYSANESLNVQLLQAQDPGGSMQIHVFGTYYGLTIALLLYRKRTGIVAVDNSHSYLTDMLVMIGECMWLLLLCEGLFYIVTGTLFLWVFWPSFNAVGLSDGSRYRAVTNTYYSLAACTIMTFALSKLLNSKNKFKMVSYCLCF